MWEQTFCPATRWNIGTSIETRFVPNDSSSFFYQSNIGCICLQTDHTAPSFYVMVPGQTGSGQGCSVDEMGSCKLPISSCPIVEQGSSSCQVTENPGDPSMSSVAFSYLVDPGPAASSGTTPTLATLQVCSGDSDRVSGPVLPGPIGSGAHFRGHYQHAVVNYDLDKSYMDFLAGHLAAGTVSGYGFAFNHFKSLAY